MTLGVPARANFRGVVERTGGEAMGLGAGFDIVWRSFAIGP